MVGHRQHEQEPLPDGLDPRLVHHTCIYHIHTHTHTHTFSAFTEQPTYSKTVASAIHFIGRNYFDPKKAFMGSHEYNIEGTQLSNGLVFIEHAASNRNFWLVNYNLK